jgi:hypothetical protein
MGLRKERKESSLAICKNVTKNCMNISEKLIWISMDSLRDGYPSSSLKNSIRTISLSSGIS